MYLAFTLDYELFGSGQGNISHHMIDPTSTLLKICEKYNVKLTFFFEVIEYWKIKEIYSTFITTRDNPNPAGLMEKQIVNAYKSGHDVQLHLHPQWLDAKYYKGHWKINDDLWKLPAVPACSATLGLMDIKQLLEKGKKTLEDMIKPYDAGYKCTILRAGGFNICPSQNILAAMREVGLKADTSVFPGGYSQNKYQHFDYRKIPNSLPYWKTYTSDILETNMHNNEENKPIYEIPIFTLPFRRFRKFDLTRIILKLKNRAAFKTTFTQANSRIRKGRRLKFLLEKEYIPWDFCLLSYPKMKYFYHVAKGIIEKSKFEFHPLVLIGHSKEFIYPKNFSKFLRFLYDFEVNPNFITLTELFKKIS